MATKKRPLRILITDDHPVYRTGLIALLQSLDFIANCYEANDGAEALEIIASKKVDVIFLDLDMPNLNGIDFLTEFNIRFENAEKPKVIVVSMDDTKHTILKCYNFGISGFISKTTSVLELKKLFQLLSEDETYYCKSARDILFKHLIKVNVLKEKEPSFPELNSIETQLLRLVCLQSSIPELADKMNKSESSIKGIRYRLFKKIHVVNIIGAVLFAIENNYISLEEIKAGLIRNSEYNKAEQ